MSKFLKIVEENRPLTSTELDKVTPLKRIFQKALFSEDNNEILKNLGLARVIITERSNDIILKFQDGVTVIYSADVVQEEESEDEDTLMTAAGVVKDINQPVKRAYDTLTKVATAKAPMIAKKLGDVVAKVNKFQA